MDVFPLYSEQIFDKICYHEELYLKNEGICSHLITDHWLRNFCQIFATWVSDKKNICGHLIEAQLPLNFSDSVRKFGGTQSSSLDLKHAMPFFLPYIPCVMWCGDLLLFMPLCRMQHSQFDSLSLYWELFTVIWIVTLTFHNRERTNPWLWLTL